MLSEEGDCLPETGVSCFYIRLSIRELQNADKESSATVILGMAMKKY